MFSSKDIEQIKNLGIPLEKVEEQIENFKNGFQPIHLLSHATVENGIININENKKEELIKFYEKRISELEITKFIPASGAATRMFKDLFCFLEQDSEPSNQIIEFINNIKKFAFFDELAFHLKKNGKDINQCIKEKNYKTIIENLLTDIGLNYGNLSKGLLLFHKYSDQSRTAAEEHIAESIFYCKGKNNKINLHFTVSPEHIKYFNDHLETAVRKYEQLYPVKINISLSVQKHSTDTIAVDLDNIPFRGKNGQLVFRPAGHGALLENLNHLNGDIIFIKNIDNVVPDNLKKEICSSKKILGGYLLKMQEKIFNYLTILENSDINNKIIEEIILFAKNKLFLPFDKNFNHFTEENKITYLYRLLHRPIRVCGMVKKQGDAGGGPFWTKDNRENISLQIVETQQINLQDFQQKSIFEESTHFSPTDIVCGTRDHKGQSFNLKEFVDPSAGFISIKSKDGKPLKAIELPGLWNGSMAQWTTIFIEVPLITFNPVKTVFDLLRKEHIS